jgi:hypothetical protein
MTLVTLLLVWVVAIPVLTVVGTYVVSGFMTRRMDLESRAWDGLGARSNVLEPAPRPIANARADTGTPCDRQVRGRLRYSHRRTRGRAGHAS